MDKERMFHLNPVLLSHEQWQILTRRQQVILGIQQWGCPWGRSKRIMWENLVGLRRVLVWEKVQLTGNRDKSSFPAWRNIAEESATGSWLLSYPLYFPPFPLLPNVPARGRDVFPDFSLMIAKGMTGYWGGGHHLTEGQKKKKSSLWAAMR